MPSKPSRAPHRGAFAQCCIRHYQGDSGQTIVSYDTEEYNKNSSLIPCFPPSSLTGETHLHKSSVQEMEGACQKTVDSSRRHKILHFPFNNGVSNLLLFIVYWFGIELWGSCMVPGIPFYSLFYGTVLHLSRGFQYKVCYKVFDTKLQIYHD